MTRLIVLSLLALVGSGCKTTEDTVVGKPPTSDIATADNATRIETERQAATAQAQYPPPVLSLATWPFVEQNTTFTLTWQGGNRPTKLHEAPDPNSPVLGDVVWNNGERVLWQSTVVSFYQPRVVRSKAEWFVEGPVYSEGYVTEQQFVQKELKKGERLEIWAYGGDGLCYMAEQRDIFSGPCPPRDQFSGLGVGRVPAEWYGPQGRIWWVQITGNNISGWFVVDDRIAVDIVSE